MQLRSWRGVGFVRRAPTRSGTDVNLRVTRMELPHVLWWHAHVQPVIDEDQGRVDRGWNWLLYVPFATAVGGILRRRPAGYTIGIVDEERGHLIPCALVQLVGRYPALDARGRRGGFVWYLSTAPEAALLGFEGSQLTADRLPKRLGQIALDVAVTHSLNHRRRGRVALHADDAGGERLLEWYLAQGMSRYPEERRIPFGPRRLFVPNDGRYCFFSVPAAVEASRRLDELR